MRRVHRTTGGTSRFRQGLLRTNRETVQVSRIRSCKQVSGITVGSCANGCNRDSVRHLVISDIDHFPCEDSTGLPNTLKAAPLKFVGMLSPIIRALLIAAS